MSIKNKRKDLLFKKESDASILKNYNIKNKFLSQINNDNTRYYYKDILKKIGEVELKLDKDLYDFTYGEIISLLRSFNYRTRDALNGVLSIIIKYIDFAIEDEDINATVGFNVAKFNIQSKDLEDFVDKINLKLRYVYGFEDLKRIVNGKCHNPQDAVIFCLLFEGIKGENFKEIRGLKREDVNITENKIKFIRTYPVFKKDKKGVEIQIGTEDKEIEIEVSDFTMETIQDAIFQRDYWTVNFAKDANSEGNPKYESRPLNETDYVLRVSGQGKPNEPVGTPVLNRRTKQVSQFMERPSMTPTTIHYSGASEYVNILLAHKGIQEPTPEIFKKACKKYGLNPKNSWQRLKRTWGFIQNNYKEMLG